MPSNKFDRWAEISRRVFLKGLVALPATAMAGSSSAVFQATEINHVTLNVSDLKRSEEFYAKVFGPAGWRLVPETDPPLVGFQFGPFMLVLEAYGERRIGIDHACLSVTGYRLQSTVAKLKGHGIEADLTYDEGLLYFLDPDGIRIQLERPAYRNSFWRRTNTTRTPSRALFKAVDVNHVTLQVSDLARSTAFYERIFEIGERDTEPTPGAALLSTRGQQLSWITYGVNRVGYDHFCISINNYEPKAVAEILRQNGIMPERPYQQTPFPANSTVFFRDPDGVLVQLASQSDYKPQH